MTKQVQRRRGTATQHTSFTGAEGELSVNTTNKSVHVHDGSTAGGIELARKDGSNVAFTSGTLDGVTIGGTTAGAGTFTNLTATGTTTLAGASTSANITFGDNNKAIFGAGSDLQIYHDGSQSFVQENGTGQLVLDTQNGARVKLTSNNGTENMVVANKDGDVELYYDNAQKLATTSTGISVTGNATFADDGKAIFGAGSDLQIYSDGSNSYIQEGSGTSGIRITTDNQLLIRKHDSENIAAFNVDGAVRLYYDNAEKIATTSTGVDITGTLTSDGLTVDGAGTFVSNSGANTLFLDGRSADNIGQVTFRSNDGATNYSQLQSRSTEMFVKTLANIPMSFYTNNAERLRITASGSVGIGTSSPDRVFHVSRSSASVISGKFESASTSGSQIVFVDADTTTNDLQVRIGSDANNLVQYAGGTERLRVTSSGSVGIGTSSPDTLLEIVGADPILTVRDSETGSATANATIRLAESGAGDTLGAYWDIKADGGKLQFIDNWNEGGGTGTRLTIDDSGNVGIGTTSPAQTLHLKSADPVIRLEDSSPDGVYAQIDGAGGGLILSADGGAGSASSFIGFRVDGTALGNEAMRIDSSGNVGIGTSSPSYPMTIHKAGDGIKFEVSDTVDANYRIQVSGANIITGPSTSSAYTFQTGNTERARIDASGNLLVGKTASSGETQGAQLQAAGNVFATASNDYPLYLNRLGSDGQLAQFRKDGTSVGSIGAYAGDLYIGNNDTGLRFEYAGTNSIVPFDTNSLAASDAVTALGATNSRFKDLHLSNVAEIGNKAKIGTGADANGNADDIVASKDGNNIGMSILCADATGNSRIYLGSQTDTTAARIHHNEANDELTIQAAGALQLQSGGVNDRLLINSSGDVGIGVTSTPQGASTATAGFWFNESSGYMVAASNADVALILNRTASTGSITSFRYNGSPVGSISVTASATAYNTSSDYRLKEDVQPMTGASDRVLTLNPVNFAWKADGNRVDGFLAHEAQAVVPEAITGEKDAVDADGNPVYQGIDQSKLVPLLTAALQEALTKIEALEARITALET